MSIPASEPLDPSGADGPLKGLCPLEGKRTNEEDLPHPGVLDGDRECTLSGIGLPFDLSSSFSFTHTVWWWTVVRWVTQVVPNLLWFDLGFFSIKRV